MRSTLTDTSTLVDRSRWVYRGCAESMLPGTSRTFLHSVPGQKIVCHSNVATHEKTSKAAASEFLLKDNTSFLFAVFLQLGSVLERFFPQAQSGQLSAPSAMHEAAICLIT